MSITNEIDRLKNAKASIKESIENKGVTVPEATKIDEYSGLIDKIEAGSSGGGYVKLFSDEFGFIDYSAKEIELNDNINNYKGLLIVVETLHIMIDSIFLYYDTQSWSVSTTKQIFSPETFNEPVNLTIKHIELEATGNKINILKNGVFKIERNWAEPNGSCAISNWDDLASIGIKAVYGIK